MKGQKEAVVEAVKAVLPGFIPFKDIALVLLSEEQLEDIKFDSGTAIIAGFIEYSKPLNQAEVMIYARSMVMNHLKKAKELNGNQVYGKSVATVEAEKKDKKLSALNMDILPDNLKAYVKSLV